MTNIEFRSGGVTFKIDLPSKINVVVGDSATGKSYFVSALRTHVMGKLGYALPASQSEINSVDPLMGGTVVVDRADMLDLSTLDMLHDTNTYLLFGRNLEYYAGESTLGFIWEDNTVTVYGG